MLGALFSSIQNNLDGFDSILLQMVRWFRYVYEKNTPLENHILSCKKRDVKFANRIIQGSSTSLDYQKTGVWSYSTHDLRE